MADKRAKLTREQEAKFHDAMINGDGYKQWRDQFIQKNGGEPNLDDPEYDYRMAWLNGIKPAPYEHDGGAYHWASSTPDGSMLKGENHPTAWMEHFMRATGTDPNELGIKSEADGKAYIAKQQQEPKYKVDIGDAEMAPPWSVSIGDAEIQDPWAVDIGDAEMQDPMQLDIGDAELVDPWQEGEAVNPAENPWTVSYGDPEIIDPWSVR